MRDLGDEDLIDLIEVLDRQRPRPVELDLALEELFARMRSEASEEKLAWVEAVIARLAWTFGDHDDDLPSGGAGVREPRRTPPGAGGAAVRLAG